MTPHAPAASHEQPYFERSFDITDDSVQAQDAGKAVTGEKLRSIDEVGQPGNPQASDDCELTNNQPLITSDGRLASYGSLPAPNWTTNLRRVLRLP